MSRRHSAFDSFTILNGSSTTLHPDPPGLPHHATHTHEARSSCFDHAANSPSIDLRRERVVAEPRRQPHWREPAARDAHVRRVPPAPCTERCVLSRRKLGCAPVLCFRANDRLISAEFGLDVHGRHKKFKEYYPKIQTTVSRTIENRLVAKY